MPPIPENPTPGRPWGRALRRTPDDIARLSRVIPDDVESANRLWQRAAPKRLRKLLKGKRKQDG